MGETEEERSVQAGQLFENFVQASTCKGTLQAFSILCRLMDLDPLEHATFYSNLKATVTSWKAKALWTKLDKRASQKEYNQSKACPGTKCLIIGGGPCGLRTSIELALLGAKVVVMEKRDTFSRNNVLHLWPYTIHDLRALGAKKFYGKFCAGAIDHISIRQLQLMLMKVALILGVEVHVNVEFVSLLEPPEQQEDAGGPGWRAQIRPSNHPISDFDFNVVIGADGRRNTLDGFRRKEFRGKLAIAITANFVNRNTTAEAKVEEISGVAFIFNQKFFLELKEETGIDLENIVYYKDNTHYFVMTAKKQSLLDKGVIIHDHMETEKLLSSGNVNQEALLSYAREAADFGTNYQLPSLDYAINPSGQPDVAMFDFTCMYASENAALARQKHGHQLLVALVGDSLLEPFWPMGTGCARGFLAAFDTAWMVRGWAQGKTPLEILAERESLYRLLPQTTTENISKNFDGYTVDPSTRYPNLNSTCVRPHQVRHLFVDGQQAPGPPEKGGPTWRSVNLSRPDAEVRPGRLLTWCQRQTEGYRGVAVTNLTSSWRNGLALCALIHHLRPELIDFDSLNEEDCAQNNQLAFDLAERELGIQAVTTGKEMALEQEPDKLLMVLYLSRFYDKFPNAPGAVNGTREPDENNEQYSSETANSAYSSMNQTQPRKRVPKEDKKLEESDPTNKRRRKGNSYLDELQLSCQSAPPAGEDGEQRENKVRSMATQLLAKFEERNASGASLRSKSEFDPLDPATPPLPSPDKVENPRFAKPKDTPPPPAPPPQPKWQPSIYLRLLEDPTVRPMSLQHTPKTLPLELVPLRSVSPFSESPECPGDADYPEYTSPSHLSLRKVSESGAQTPGDNITQRKCKASAREFSRKSISERAVLLSSMFPDSSSPHLKTDHSTFPLHTDLSPSSPPPPSIPKSPAVHPVPEPAAVCGFSPPISSSFPSLLPRSPQGPEKGQKLREWGQDQSVKDVVHINLKEKVTDKVRAEVRKVVEDVALEKRSGNAASSKMIGKTIVRSESCPAGAVQSSKQRTVGRVSSVIGAKAETLAILYETDHRPNSSPCVGRRGEFAQTLGGSDTCHFCRKRVYVMERLGAEGLFFHRECLRCDVCSCTLRLGGHAFDSQQGKFYCKMHYSQRRPSTAPVNFRKRADDQVRVTTSGDDTGQSTGGHARPRAQPGRGVGSPRKGLVPDVVEETLDTADGITGADSRKNENSVDMKAKAQDQKDVSKSADRSSRWKRRIRATLPLILVRTFQKGRASDKESTPIPEADSDYEEVSHNAAERPPTTQNALPGSEECPVPGKDITCSSSPKKKLIISVSEKEKLLDWNLGTLEEPSGFPGALGGQTTSDPVSQSQPPQPGQEPDPELGPVPTHPDPTQGPPPTAFQQLANALRRSLGMSGSASTAAVTRRAGPRRQRPLSEGAFNYSSMFGSGPPGQEERMREQRRPTGGDLTTLLEQVSLGRGQPGGRAFTDDMASLPPRRVNFFSSLRLKKRERGEGEAGEGEHIRTILSNIRNKASSQEQLDASYSSSDDDNSLAGQTDCPDKLKRRQERMVAQQAKTEQLKRLHRAQVIQRQLEEVGEKQRDLEERGVSIEKRLRGEETDDSLSDEGVLYQSWFTLVLEKNRLERYEEELMIFAQELELEDTQSRLQQELRRRMAIDDTSKSASELVAEQRILEEMMGVVERRDTLVSELEEQRLRERAEDRDLESLVLSKGYQFHWASE
ncbi:protein-methionine sulfoxide oxidase mical2b isoform X2 [Hypomesus transpacificus]|uniref:protein-methionine sulfoxide oxidase mical2b isoform X2 n=1 Tax=Hypomesus transpacificus TaxID=137520 RepID=UPI001F072D31|nr:protein-methionine sulfoxide oxidase mical2b isoform X2 [Hypomesus transpacificus]